jgi:AraC-like DNA-binding protein
MFLEINQTKGNAVFNRARWLMAGGIGLLAIHFLLQFTLRFRESGTTQGVLVNLLFFPLACYLINIAILYLQRQGAIRRHEWWMGLGAYAVIILLLVVPAIIKGVSLLTETNALIWGERISVLIFISMLIYYYILQYKDYIRMKRMLDNFYDYDKAQLVRWLSIYSLGMMLLIDLVLPAVIFSSPVVYGIYGIVIFTFVFFNVFNFICFGVSADAQQVQLAEQNANESKTDSGSSSVVLSDTDYQQVAKAVEEWIAKGGHLHCGITMQTAANEMRKPRYQLSAWLKTTPYELFNPWLTHLRIEEAKKLLKAHPDWSNDIIAENCGFTTRNYFQTVFKKSTGMTPAEYQTKEKLASK